MRQQTPTTVIVLWALCSFSLCSIAASNTLEINQQKKASNVALKPIKNDQKSKPQTGQLIGPSSTHTQTGIAPAPNNGIQTLPSATIKSSTAPAIKSPPKIQQIAPSPGIKSAMPGAIKQPTTGIQTPPPIQRGMPSQGIKTTPAAPARVAPSRKAPGSSAQNPRPTGSGGLQTPNASGFTPNSPGQHPSQHPGKNSGAVERPAIDSSGALPTTPAPPRNGGVNATPAGPGFAQPSTASDGTPTYTLDNGQQVPATGRDGSPAIVGRDGSVSYDDGTSVSTNRSGETVVTRPDGSQRTNPPPQSGGPGFAQPSTASDGTATYTLDNGQQVPATGRDGSPAIVGRDGSVSYNDGTSVSTNRNGETVITSPDGSQRTNPPPPSGGPGFAQPSTASDGTPTYTLDNGQQVPASGQDGSPAIVGRDGSVSYNDGTSVSTNSDGDTVVTSPDGNQRTSTPEASGTGFATPATTVEGESVYVLSNGENVANSDGLLINRDGSLTGRDGTHVYVDPVTNETVVVNPDGSERSRQPQPSERQGSQSNNNQSGNSSNDDDDEDDDSDDDNGSDDNDDGNDSDDSGGDDGQSDDDTDDEGSDEAGSGVGLAEAGIQHESKTTADDFVARKRGEKREPESIAPPICGENGSGPPRGVSEPQPGEGVGGCVPAGLTPSAEEEEEEEETEAPIFVIPSSDDFRDPSNNGGVNIDPTGRAEDMRREGPSFEQQLEDIGNTVNPGS